MQIRLTRVTKIKTNQWPCEWYLEDMSDNIKNVLTSKRKNGFHIGAFALYGYKKDPNQKGHLIIHEEAAKRSVYFVFKRIWQNSDC